MSKEEALRIAELYCGSEHIQMEIYESLPHGEFLYTTSASSKPLWYVFVHDTNMLRVGGSRCLAIERSTGKVVGDGLVGE